jgi:hypothetical protein
MPAVQFSINPASTHDGVIDFTTKEGRSHYDKATRELHSPFDCVEDQLLDFMSSLKDRAVEFGWNKTIMRIPINGEDEESEEKSLLDHHGSITLDMVRNFEDIYKDTQGRERQDMHCLYKCLMATLSREGRAKVQTEKDKYVLKDEGDEEVYSGNLLLKVILMKTTVDNKSGAYAVRMELAKLPELIEKINFDIPKFNERVKNLIGDLNNRGQTSDDLTFNLFQAYKQVPVEAFTIFIDRIKDQEDDTDAISTSFIMDKAENKFKTLQKEGNWTVKEKDEDKIMVLQAKIKRLEKANRARGNRKDQNSNKKKGHKKGSRNPKHKIDIDRRPKDIRKPVTINGKKWWWCCTELGGLCEGKLRRHTPKECKGSGFKPTKNNKNSSANDAAKEFNKLKVSEAKIMEMDTDDDDDVSM